jgi:hypothetical protein
MESELRKAIQTKLASVNLLGEATDLRLSVKVRVDGPPEDGLTPWRAVATSVEFSEPIQVIRDLSVRMPGAAGGITWVRNSLRVCPKNEVGRIIEQEVNKTVEEFIGDVEVANAHAARRINP